MGNCRKSIISSVIVNCKSQTHHQPAFIEFLNHAFLETHAMIEYFKCVIGNLSCNGALMVCFKTFHLKDNTFKVQGVPHYAQRSQKYLMHLSVNKQILFDLDQL